MRDYKGKLPDQVISSKNRNALVIDRIMKVEPDVFGICDLDVASSLHNDITKLGYSEYQKV
jgi:hypothetical protein